MYERRFALIISFLFNTKFQIFFLRRERDITKFLGGSCDVIQKLKRTSLPIDANSLLPFPQFGFPANLSIAFLRQDKSILNCAARELPPFLRIFVLNRSASMFEIFQISSRETGVTGRFSAPLKYLQILIKIGYFNDFYPFVRLD